MSKMKELFVDNINKAMGAADLMNDVNSKPMAYAAIAHALAVYLNGEMASGETITASIPVATEEEATKEELTAPVEPTKKEEPVNEVQEEALRLSEKNKEIIKAIDEAIAKQPAWELPYDENGIPYLNDEDFAIPERVMAYENALTPEILEKRREIEIAQGNALMNELNGAETQEAPAPVAPVSEEPVEFVQEELDSLEAYKTTFDYANNPAHLDNLYHNFTDGVHSSLADLSPKTLNPFLIYIKEELAKAYASVEEWKSSWITKEGLDALISQAYGVEGATIEQYLHDGNVFWFIGYVELYNANAWLNSYEQSLGREVLDDYAKQFFEDSSLSLANINDENVIGFVQFIQGITAQTA